MEYLNVEKKIEEKKSTCYVSLENLTNKYLQIKKPWHFNTWMTENRCTFDGKRPVKSSF